MINVKRRDKEPIDKLLRRFKKRCEREGLIKDIRKTEYYEKPSVKKRRETQRLKKRIEKENQGF